MTEASEKTDEKGPDNNRRLALVEERLPSLISATGTLIATLAPDLEVARGEDEEDIDWLLRLLGETVGKAEQLVTAHAGVAAERDTLKAAATKASNAPKATAVKAVKLRKIAPLLKDGEVGPSSAQLLEAIAGASEVEIAFSDGRQEIAGLDPIRVEGDVWRASQAGLRLDLREPLEVIGPDKGAYELAGYGLLLDGKLVAYRPRIDVWRIAANQRVNLNGDVTFGG